MVQTSATNTAVIPSSRSLCVDRAWPEAGFTRSGRDRHLTEKAQAWVEKAYSLATELAGVPHVYHVFVLSIFKESDVVFFQRRHEVCLGEFIERLLLYSCILDIDVYDGREYALLNSRLGNMMFHYIEPKDHRSLYPKQDTAGKSVVILQV